MRNPGSIRKAIFLLALWWAWPAHAAEALVGAASNFSAPLERLEAAFEGPSGHRLNVSLGSTGKLYAQVVNGAPFDLFLSADRERAGKLVEMGAASAGNRFTYAVGRLVLWYPGGSDAAPAGPEILKARTLRNVAVAHPELAPYGSAAREVLQALGVTAALEDRLVVGENIGQTFAFVGSGNAEAGFVAAAQLVGRRPAPETVWTVPAGRHAAIRQDAVLLRRGEANPAARAFFEFLKSDEARAIIRAHGYAPD